MNNKSITNKNKTKYSKKAYLMTFCMCVATLCYSLTPMYCAGKIDFLSSDFWKTATSVLNGLFILIIAASASVGVVSIVFALFLSLLSHNPRKIQEGREIAKNILGTCIIIFSVGMIAKWAVANIFSGASKTFSFDNPFGKSK